MSGLLDPQRELVGGLGREREITLIMELWRKEEKSFEGTNKVKSRQSGDETF